MRDTNDKNIAVFDIGGSSFRSALYSHVNGLTECAKRPALNFKNTPYTRITELQEKLVDFLVERVNHFRAQGIVLNNAAVSMGAAMNGHFGNILNSGPLWGPDCQPFDLIGALRQRKPDIDWIIINDVSAALLRHVMEWQGPPLQRMTLITLSTGIACRTYDFNRSCIPLNQAGLQGEIGHLPIHFFLFGKHQWAHCDCGGLNHLNAFASGRGIENVLRILATAPEYRNDSSSFLHALQQGVANDENLTAYLAMAVKAGDSLATDVLDAITVPMAEMLVHILTIDANIEKIFLTGGVVHGLGDSYWNRLKTNFMQIGMYAQDKDTELFERVVELGFGDDNSGLIGAGIAHAKSRK